MTDKPQALLPVTPEATIEFLNHAFRNIELPPLSPDDVEDIRDGLGQFARISHSLPGDGMLRAHFTRMMEAAANYLEPTTYVARHPQHGTNGPCRFTTEFPMPDEGHSDCAKADINGRRDQAFIRDMIYMLDGPEQRAALTPSALSGDEPIALLLENPETGDREVELFRHGAACLTDADKAAGWRETRLYARAALQGAGEP